MKLNELYKEQAEVFCELHNKVTAEDILRQTKEQTVEQDNIVSFETKKKPHTWKGFLSVASIAIVCTLAVATTALAATGVLQDILRKMFKDETSAELAEQGHFYEANKTATDGPFRVDFIGVTGDDRTAKMFFDIYVDESIDVTGKDEMRVWVSTIGTDTGDNEGWKEYGPYPAYGVKDEENDHLYHVTRMDGTVRMQNGIPMLVKVKEIEFCVDTPRAEHYDVDIEFSMNVPEDAFVSAVFEYHGGLPFAHETNKYYLNYVTFGVYRTDLNIVFDYDDQSPESQGLNSFAVEEMLQKPWRQFISEVTLVADGTEYRVKESDEGYGFIWYDVEGEAGIVNRCYVNPQFPAIDYENAKEILIKWDDVVYVLK